MGVAEDKTRIVLTVSKDLKAKLDKQAQKENRSVANLINTLITDYLWKTEEIELQLYLTYLANSFLSNNFNYNFYLDELVKQGYDFSKMNSQQIFVYIRSYVIASYDDILNSYANDKGFSFEKFNSMQKSTQQLFGIYDGNTNPFYPIKKD